MKILFTVEFYEPHKGGAEEVVRQLAERLAQKGHQVFVATTFLPARASAELSGVKIEQFKISGNGARGVKATNAEIERYRQLLKQDFDAVINYAAQSWPTDLAFAVLDKIRAKKILVPCGYSGLNNPAYQAYFRQLSEYLRQYDRLVYMSPNYQDKIFGDQNGAGQKAVIIPNGAAAEEFLGADNYQLRQKFKINTKYLAICVANHYRDKGHGFVVKAFNRLDRSDVTLLIIGQNPGANWFKKIKQFFAGCYKTCYFSSLVNSRIRLIKGDDRGLVVAAYKSADVFLFGSKVECAPLVMYEAFAAKSLFISTPVGNIPDHKDAAVLVKTPQDMAERLNYYLDHEPQRQTLVNLAFELWQKNHTWDNIAGQYERLIFS